MFLIQFVLAELLHNSLVWAASDISEIPALIRQGWDNKPYEAFPHNITPTATDLQLQVYICKQIAKEMIYIKCAYLKYKNIFKKNYLRQMRQTCCLNYLNSGF